MTNNGRMTIEDTLASILDVLQQIAEQPSGGAGNSSIDIEDMANGKVKVTTKGYVGIPLTEEYIRQRMAEHGLAHRLAEAAAVNQWKETLEVERSISSHAYQASADLFACALCRRAETHPAHHGPAVRPNAEALPDFTKA